MKRRFIELVRGFLVDAGLLEVRGLAAGCDTMGAFERGFTCGWKVGVDAGVEVALPVSEARRVMIAGSRAQGVTVPAVLYGEVCDGWEVDVPLGEECLLVRCGGRVLRYEWAARASAGGVRWIYRFTGEVAEVGRVPSEK